MVYASSKAVFDGDRRRGTYIGHSKKDKHLCFARTSHDALSYNYLFAVHSDKFAYC